jgi:hypothetical protein
MVSGEGNLIQLNAQGWDSLALKNNRPAQKNDLK